MCGGAGAHRRRSSAEEGAGRGSSGIESPKLTLKQPTLIFRAPPTIEGIVPGGFGAII
jgi:hypothetical protein